MKTKRLFRYDVLRVIATLMVAGYHFDAALPDYLAYQNYPRPLLNGLGTYLFDGSLAVTIFFMLSGFFTYGSIERDNFSGFAYIKKRMGRLLVPTWIAWVLATIICLFLGSFTVDSGWKILLTICGFDGYQSAYLHLGGFWLVGEWCTGGGY